MGEIMFIALIISVPLWLILCELAEINKKIYYDDDEENEE